jgi:tRNA(Ile)-lysidine synthetase-like protein
MPLLPGFGDALGTLLKGRPRRALLAVSGGPDSMALLDLAARAGLRDLFLAVGHVDHGLRGRASAADAAFVRREAARRGLPFRLARAPVRVFAAAEGLGTEEAARVLRYGALARMAAALRCGTVLTAHTLDDQAETVLMNLIRGAGPDGLAGMSPASPWPVGPSRGLLLGRPLLSVDRASLMVHLKEARVPFRTDATNALPLFFRNRVRPVLKAWERERPGLSSRIARLAEILRDEEGFWDGLLGGISGARRKNLDLGSFKRYHKAIQRRLLRRAFGLASFAAVERARAFALDPGPAPRQSVPGGWVEKRDRSLVFRPLKLSAAGRRYK